MGVKAQCGEAGDPGARAQHPGIERRMQGHHARDRRARSHEAHVALQDVPELRQFVRAAGAQQALEPRHPRRLVAAGDAVAARIGAHAAQLDEAEPLARRPHPFREMKDRPPFGRQQHHDQQRQRQGHQRAEDQRQPEVERPLARGDAARGAAGPGGWRRDRRAERKLVLHRPNPRVSPHVTRRRWTKGLRRPP